MIVTRDGLSLITAGLDAWFRREGGGSGLDESEFRVEEWRLQRLLNVDHFRLPPDYRSAGFGEPVPNSELTVPFLRFPQWHYCPKCGLLKKLPLTARGKQHCPGCEAKGKKRGLVQVPFVAMCDHGHLQDFPWTEWVHKSSTPKCSGKLHLSATGGATLASQMVRCECGAERSLGQVTVAFGNGEETELSKNLDSSGKRFTCRGQRPWLGTEEGEPCSRPLRGSLRSAANIYFGQVSSALYLPQGEGPVSEIVKDLEQPPLSSLIRLLGKAATPEALRSQHPLLLKDYADNEIAAALEVAQRDSHPVAPGETQSESVQSDLRWDEYRFLCAGCNDEDLKVTQMGLQLYEPFIKEFFSGVSLVTKLRETRVFTGFTRVLPEDGRNREERKTLLWRTTPLQDKQWLPAYVVFGEGIFVRFDEVRLNHWAASNKESLDERLDPLLERFSKILDKRRLKYRPIGPGFILLHTFAHLLMNRMTFECGYSSAALRERLYVSDENGKSMAGVLIYTAAGDAEGTLGGLVRMGKPGNFEPLIRKAIDNARWCSADPVCMELGRRGGQGPDSCNLAACHNCALVPETACEEFNRFLDRILVVGELTSPDLGYFGEHCSRSDESGQRGAV